MDTWHLMVVAFVDCEFDIGIAWRLEVLLVRIEMERVEARL
jgi:hypothetical protein